MARMGWIPQAALGAAGILIVGGSLGCGSKDAGIPTAPPVAAAEPDQIFKHLQYLAVRKDYKHVALIAPVDPAIVYSSAGWFHKHATDLKLDLNDEELAGLGISDMKEKLKALPSSEGPDYPLDKARLAFNAGIYRVLKGVPTEAWGKVVVSQVKKNPGNTRIMDVFFAHNGKQFLQVSCIKKSDGAYGVSFIRYLVTPTATFGGGEAKSKG